MTVLDKIGSNMIQRIIKNNFIEKIKPGKVIVLVGPRQVGKTTLVKEIASELSDNKLFISGDEIKYHEYLSSQSKMKLAELVDGVDYLFIDEAQKIPNIGINLKILVDEFKDLKIVITGSFSLDLNIQTGEPLVGRKWTLKLFPIAFSELADMYDVVERSELLENMLIYGSYPEVINHKNDKLNREYLDELINSYLYKDILEFNLVKNSKIIRRLLTLIAFQIGHDVSINELANNLEISKNTVAKYLDLLEKSFIIINVHGFSRNLRSELTKMGRYYFYDNGVRNALISNYNPLSLRNDIGQLWENFLVIERLKKQEYSKISSNNYFWRTYEQQEIDWIEERGGKLYAYEFKYSKRQAKIPTQFKKAYPDAEFKVISQKNYERFII